MHITFTDTNKSLLDSLIILIILYWYIINQIHIIKPELKGNNLYINFYLPLFQPV